ncbi:MAG: sulfite exporter TauE/SafE family protein [Dechloromonas sp.]|nr:sulfite exporter TauE/SafE family protein [Dechloromonas sp.]
MNVLALTDLLGLLLLGAGLGFFGGLFGIGGGIIAIPVLALAFGMEQALAQGTSLAMMVPILLVGWWRYQRRQPAPGRSAWQLALSASLTTWLVARLATGLDAALLRTGFGVFLLFLALHLLRPRHRPTGSPPPAGPDSRWLPAVGVIGGACMGFLGVGAGLVATPLLTRLFGLRQTVAQSLSLALVTPSAVVALLTYSQAGRVDGSMGLPLAIGGLCTVSAGISWAHRLPERQMQAAFAWMILLTAGWLLLKPLFIP